MVIIGVLFLMLLSPILLLAVHSVKSFPFVDRMVKANLVGVTLEEKKPEYSLASWWNGQFQKHFTTWFEQNFPLREAFIRLNNQIYFSLFSKSYMANGVIVVGKDGQLLSTPYIYVETGQIRPMPIETAQELVEQMAEMQNLLKMRGIMFLVLITPSKAATYPEYIPDVFGNARKGSKRDYDNMVELFNQYTINYVDGQRTTLEQKQQSSYPLFPQGGIHWNYLGAFYSTAALISKIESLSDKKLKHITLESVEVDDNPQGSDRDFVDLLNLMYPPAHYLVPHPILKVTLQDYRPKFAIVGGSFVGAPLELLSQSKVFSLVDYYIYYKVGFLTIPRNQAREYAFKSKQLNWRREFLTKNIIVLEINEEAFQSRHVSDFLQDGLRVLKNETIPDESNVREIVDNYVTDLKFGQGGNAERFQEYGWSVPEDGFTWTDGKTAGLWIPVSLVAGDVVVKINLYPFNQPGNVEKQRVTIYNDGHLLSSLEVAPAGDYEEYSIEVPRQFISGSVLNLRFDLPDAVPPLGTSDRELGIAVKSISVTTKDN